MKRYGHIFEKIIDLKNIELAHKKARRDKSHYHEVQLIDQMPGWYCYQIHYMLKTYSYKIKLEDYKELIINDKGKERVLKKLPYYPHRIIQWAIMLQLQEIFHKTFTPFTCASLPNRGINLASYLTKKYLKKDREGTKYCLKMDVHHFYPSIDTKILKNMLRKKFKDPELLWLLDTIINSHPEGIPIGSYLSQYMANFYLSYFDHWIKEELKVKYYIRYMDDLIILSDNKEQLHAWRKKISKYLEENLHLNLKKNWQVFPVESRGVDFVGYVMFHDYTLLRKKTKKRMIKSLLKINKNLKKRKRLIYRETCVVYSYLGWLKNCDSYQLRQKYFIDTQLESFAFSRLQMGKMVEDYDQYMDMGRV